MSLTFLGDMSRETRLAVSNQTTAPIECPMKKSTIIWARCVEARRTHHCLCKEARARLRHTEQGEIEFRVQLRRILEKRKDIPDGWEIRKNTRFANVFDENGECVHIGSHTRYSEDYVRLVAEVRALREENRKLLGLMRDELVGTEEDKPSLDELMDGW